jgi:predicted dienelactone hydrolase
VHEGFIVIAIRHNDLMEGKVHANHWLRAKDIKMIIDQFFASPMGEFAHANEIGVAGYSLGGTTAIWVAGGRTTKLDTLIPGSEYADLREFRLADQALPGLNKEMMNKDWRDPRIKAAFVMAPAWAWLFDESSLERISIPTYLIAAEADQVVITKNNAGFFARHIPHAIYQTIPGKVGHYIFISALNERQRKLADLTGRFDFLFQDDATVDRAWLQLQIGEEATKFFHSVFNGSNSE